MDGVGSARLMTRDNYTTSRGRNFGLTLGIAFAAVGAFSFWRGHPTTPKVLGAISAILIVVALAAPRSLELVERAWMKLAHLISRVTTPIFLALVYFAVLTPMGLIRRNFGRNPLKHFSNGDSYWFGRAEVDAEKRRKSMERQF